MTNYVLGKGKVYIDLLDDTTKASLKGERFFGNCPEFSTSSSADAVDHYASTGGIKVKDKSVNIQFNRSGKFTTDEVSLDNQALFVLGDVASITQTAQTGLTETKKLYKGRYFQLGVDASNPSGKRKLASLVVTTSVGGTVQTQSTNYTIDYDLGRLYVLDNAATITDGTDYVLTYNTVVATNKRVASSNKSIYAALRFVADNPAGENRDFYLPYVKLAPDGDYSLIGDDWQTMGFNMEILKRDDLTESMYIDGRAA